MKKPPVFFDHVQSSDESPVWSAIASRKSVRNYRDTPVEDWKVERILEAARRAPSWANKQCWHFVVVKGKEEVDSLGIAPAYMKGIPLLVVACGDPDKSGNVGGKPYYMVDVAIATEHIVLAAWELGLGTCWVGAFKEEKVKAALGIPDKIRVVALLPVGYPAEKEGIVGAVMRRIVGAANRKDPKEIIHYGKW